MDLSHIPSDQPVLIAGPTASGKSALALQIASRQGGVIVNADALQVYSNWSVLTARPSSQDLLQVPHFLYGHVAPEAPYSTGHWLRDVSPLLAAGPRPIIVGGTGLNFTALTEGLAEIPPTPDEVRQSANQISLPDLIAALDDATLARIDLNNRARVQRAYEVLMTTGSGLANWQDNTPPPLLPLAQATSIVIEADREWLAHRIALRFDLMLSGGALDEAKANLDRFDPTFPADRAIGAPELIAYLRGSITLDQARDAAIVASRQYAKRQRTWFRARMKSWMRIDAQTL